MKTKNNTYTCKEYRSEMMLLGLTKRLHQENLSEDEKQKIRKEIEILRREMGMD